MSELPGRVFLYDTTLRDGGQTEGVTFSCEDKLEILKRLDEFGMDFIEGGWPGSNPTDDEFFRKAESIALKSRLVSFGCTRKHDIRPEDDSNLIALKDCSCEWCCIFGKAWSFHVIDALGITREENLAMVRDSIRFLKNNGKHVIFDAEHFFDGYKDDPEYAMDVIKTAATEGAEWVVLCDTNGGTMPDEVSRIVTKVESATDVPLGIHCHNDSDMATADTLAAVDHGCTMVQGTINGLGERCGNTNLCTVIPNLMFKKGYTTGIPNMKALMSLSLSVGEIANLPPNQSMPYVGLSAFTHKGGIHVSAVIKDGKTYEHIDPASVGNSRRLLVSDMAGKASIAKKLEALGLDCGDDSEDIANIIKEMESRGYQFEGADASFELLVKRTRGSFKPKFTLDGFRIFIDERKGGMDSEASIKVRDTSGTVEQTAADGNGPVNALDMALRKSLVRFYPRINDIRLTDYKVRVLDEKAATAARVRVMIRSTDGKDSWTTIGVSEDVVSASLIALVDSFEYALMDR